MINDIQKTAESKMQRSVEVLKENLAKVRTGRAHTGLLDQVEVEYWGSMVPVSQVANVTLLDARTIGVKPFESNMAAKVEKAIRDSNLGLNPAAVGDLIRVPMPMLTEERRKDLIKVVRSEAEEGRVSIRNVRRDANDHIKKLLKDKEISEDEARRGEEAVQSNVGNVEVAADPSRQVRTDDRDGGEQVNNHLRTPEGHLSPRQQVTHKGFCHQCQENQGTENPHQFARFFVRTVNQAAEHVQVYDDEEERCAGGVHIADNPATGHVAHDVLYCGKGSRQMIGIQVAVRFVVHGQEDTADDLNHEDEQSQRAEVVPEVEVLRRVVLSQMLIPHFRQREASVHPA